MTGMTRMFGKTNTQRVWLSIPLLIAIIFRRRERQSIDSHFFRLSCLFDETLLIILSTLNELLNNAFNLRFEVRLLLHSDVISLDLIVRIDYESSLEIAWNDWRKWESVLIAFSSCNQGKGRDMVRVNCLSCKKIQRNFAAESFNDRDDVHEYVCLC